MTENNARPMLWKNGKAKDKQVEVSIYEVQSFSVKQVVERTNAPTMYLEQSGMVQSDGYYVIPDVVVVVSESGTIDHQLWSRIFGGSIKGDIIGVPDSNSGSSNKNPRIGVCGVLWDIVWTGGVEGCGVAAWLFSKFCDGVRFSWRGCGVTAFCGNVGLSLTGASG